jgi:myb proto-oncogene protein
VTGLGFVADPKSKDMLGMFSQTRSWDRPNEEPHISGFYPQHYPPYLMATQQSNYQNPYCFSDFIFCHPTATINYNPFTFSSNGLSVILEHIHIKHLSDMISAKNNNPFQPFFFSFLSLYF